MQLPGQLGRLIKRRSAEARLLLRIPVAGPRWERGIELLLLIGAVGLPAVASRYEIQLFTHIAIFCLLALSLDLVWGYGGILDLGRAAIFGWPAYFAALMATRAGLANGFVVVPASMLFGAGLALVVSVVLFVGHKQYRGIFVAMATLVLAYGSERTATVWPDVGSANGIPNVPLMSLAPLSATPLATGPTFFWIVVALVAITYVVLKLLVTSQFGLVLAASRDRDRRVTFLGYRTARYRAVIYTLSGAIAGAGGALYAFHEGYVAPDVLGVNLSTQVLLWVLIGGRGKLLGALIGTIAMNYVSIQLSGTFQVVWQIILGVLLVVLLTALPDGITGALLRRKSSDFGRRGSQP